MSCQVWGVFSIQRVLCHNARRFLGGGKREQGVNADPSAITYAVKVVQDTADFRREVDALEAIAALNPPDFYAVGAVPMNGDPSLFREGSGWVTGKSLTMPNGIERWWWKLSQPLSELEGGVSEPEGGVIFMQHGRSRFTDEPWDTSVVGGLCGSLRRAHSAGFLHCDIRESNVVYFQTLGWQLVDYGLSCRIDSNEVYDLAHADVEGAQARGAGPRVRRFLDFHERFHWTVADDYEMLLKMVGLLLYNEERRGGDS
jgi:serine/threonine protein kinase